LSAGARHVADVHYLLVAGVTLLVVCYKLRGLSSDWRNAPLLSLCAALACGGLTFAVGAPVSYTAIDDLTGVPNLAGLLSLEAATWFAVALQMWLRLWSAPAGSPGCPGRSIIRGNLVVAVVLAVLFALGHHPVEAVAAADLVYATDPATAALTAVFNVAFVVSVLTTAWMCHRNIRRLPRGCLRRGARLVSLGALACAGYPLGTAVALGARWSGGNADWWRLTFSITCATVGSALLLAGSTLPASTVRVDMVLAWMGRVQAYAAIAPLWLALQEDGAKAGCRRRWRPGRHAWALRDIDVRLYERVVEVRDAQLGLCRFIDPRVADLARDRARAAGLPVCEQEAVAEAAVTASALRRRRQGLAGGSPGAGPLVHSAGATFADELASLIRVARAFRSSPVVRSLG
jgi:hypothetical protein